MNLGLGLPGFLSEFEDGLERVHGLGRVHGRGVDCDSDFAGG